MYTQVFAGKELAIFTVEGFAYWPYAISWHYFADLYFAVQPHIEAQYDAVE